MNLARILEVDEAEIIVVQFNAAIWSEAQLGCTGRKGLYESTPIPGYKILLQYRDQFYEYHTDSVGNFRLCSPPQSPWDQSNEEVVKSPLTPQPLRSNQQFRDEQTQSLVIREADWIAFMRCAAGRRNAQRWIYQKSRNAQLIRRA